MSILLVASETDCFCLQGFAHRIGKSTNVKKIKIFDIKLSSFLIAREVVMSGPLAMVNHACYPHDKISIKETVVYTQTGTKVWKVLR